MAALVSHAMRRYPLSPPDGVYSSYNLRDSTGWPQTTEESESALSRSMRYADPWLYGNVLGKPTGTLVLTPALVLCSCPDFLNGTKKSGPKKGPTLCKKCKGTRVSISSGNGEKFGTVRCYSTSSTSGTLHSLSSSNQVRAGTVRVTSTSRASILPNADPYDLMRRSRLNSKSDQPLTSPFRGRSISPTKRTNGTSRNSSRRSILECDINPYELISSTESSEKIKDSSITFVNGQRIRVRPQAPDPDYEDVNEDSTLTPKKSPTKQQQQQQQETTNENLVKKCKPNRLAPEPPSSPIQIMNEDRNNPFKSILKKSTKESKSTSNTSTKVKGASHFYLPLPNTPRKKVQFLVENSNSTEMKEENSNVEEVVPDYEDIETLEKENQENLEDEESISEENDKICTLRRSTSERFKNESQKVVFLDTMALRMKTPRNDSRDVFNTCDLEKLDGIPKRKVSPRPKEPPPLPPPIENEEKIQEIIEIKENEEQKTNPPDVTKLTIENKVDGDSKISPQAPPRKKSVNKSPTLQKNEHNEEILPPIPRKRSTTKQPIIKIETPEEKEKFGEYQNKTIVQITPSSPVHKIQIKNEFPEEANIQTISISDNLQRKTSILINGDDCYSTVNVNDDIPLYQSSVVVKDYGITEISPNNRRSSSSVYITGIFNDNSIKEIEEKNETCICKVTKEGKIDKEVSTETIEIIDTKERPSTPDMLREILKDPVEAVKRNLVPHICGKSDLTRRQRDLKLKNYYPMISFSESSPKDISDKSPSRIFESLIEDDKDSEHSSSTQYEFVDPGSDCYTDHSNRSSVTEDELSNRTKFYELLADSTLLEVSENEDHHYECIKIDNDPIYEEIEIPPPLPSNPPPINLLDDLKLDKEFTTRSIFEGASKYDILSYLVDAKERGIVPEDSYTFSNISVDDTKENTKICHMSSVSDSSEDNSLVISNDDKSSFQTKSSEIERNDSGVGSETSKSSLSKYRTKQITSIICEDCETSLDTLGEDEQMLCHKCLKKRCERKEIIMEIVETEEKYSKDLQIILEEFQQPMLVAGLLTPEQLSTIFLNVEELLENSQTLAERLRDAVEIAIEQGDEDLLTVNMGKLFLEATPMLHAFETYCVRQGPSSLLLASLEKEKELLRIFLRVSQMENTLLRRMNLNSFLMVPVQRVTKYPLLLARLYKVTPNNNEVKEQLKEAQHKIELHLNHMNSQTKDVPSKLWRRIGSSSGRRPSTEMDLVNIKLRKIAVDVLEWNHDEAKFALEGKLWFTQPTDNNWRKGRTIKLSPVNALLVINGKPTSKKSEKEETSLIFPKHSATREAALLLVRDKNGRYSLLRDPLYLDRCVIASDPAWQSYFEVQELLGKDTFIFKAEDEEQTKSWYQQLQFHAQGMGAWRKRRNALANIMMSGMGLRL